jgi:polysaccharide deacetylase family protein (PEP-CTERM system associated)
MINFLTIDVEEYFQVSGLSDVAPREKWENFESRIEQGVELLLNLLKDTKATFFVLGWIAGRKPELIKKISNLGHEVATHGMDHKLVTSMSREEFKDDVNASIRLLEDLTRKPVIGHRAPSFSITEKSQWALDILAQSGLKYDSSVFPLRRRRGGWSGAEEMPYRALTACGEILEFPLPVWDFLGKRIPAVGGGFFRLYPYWMTKNILRKINSAGRPAVFYLHPWEIDAGQPRLKSRLTRDGFNHYVGLKTSCDKLKRLLADFQFTSIQDCLENHRQRAEL